MSAPRAVLFDVDGVLLDAAGTVRRVWDRWSDLHELDRAVVWSQTTGRRPVQTVTAVAPTLDAEAEVVRLRELHTEESASAAFPGATALLQTLPRDRWGVLATGRREGVLERLSLAGLPVPPVLVGPDQAQCALPDPAANLLLARQIGAEPGQCLVVDDSAVGVAAGVAAGMSVLGISSTHPAPVLLGAGARRVEADLSAAGPVVLAWALGAPLPA